VKLRDRSGAIGGLLLAAVAGFAIAGPALDRHPPERKDLQAGVSALGEPLPPSRAHPLGTDPLGRCVAARVAAGARLSLGLGLGAAVLALGLGLALGLLAGGAGGLCDGLVVWLSDLVLAFPVTLLAVALAASLRTRGAELGAVLLVLTGVGWTGIARVVRARARALLREPFIEAARAGGAGRARIMLTHLLPNLVGAAVALATLAAAGLVAAEASLSYLGLGPPPPAASWGRMLREAQPYLHTAPWLWAAPGAAVLVTVLGLGLCGETLRRAWDPRERR
jgi:peptide/nickel transport system permease protein